MDRTYPEFAVGTVQISRRALHSGRCIWGLRGEPVRTSEKCAWQSDATQAAQRCWCVLTMLRNICHAIFRPRGTRSTPADWCVHNCTDRHPMRWCRFHRAPARSSDSRRRVVFTAGDGGSVEFATSTTNASGIATSGRWMNGWAIRRNPCFSDRRNSCRQIWQPDLRSNRRVLDRYGSCTCCVGYDNFLRYCIHTRQIASHHGRGHSYRDRQQDSHAEYDSHFKRRVVRFSLARYRGVVRVIHRGLSILVGKPRP